MSELRDKIRDILTSNLGDSYYCNRVWSAWSYGTMSEDDFEEVNESENIDDIVNEILPLIHTPKHETVSDWEKRTGETYPNDGPVWSRWKTTHKDYGHWFLITNGRAQDELETEVYNKERYIIIVANHHGKPEDV